MYHGMLAELARWPVKSLRGERLSAARVDGRGLGGDRTHALVDQRPNRAGALLTVRQAPRMLSWSATYAEAPDDALDPADPPLASLRGPDGSVWRWDDHGLAAVLGADLGLPLALRRDPAGQQDLERSVLVTFEASRRAAERSLGRPLALRRFRTKLHLELDAPPYAEERFQGRRLTVGEVELELLHPCGRCAIPTWDPDRQQRWPELLTWLQQEHGGLFGINARVLGAGRIAVGDPVSVR
jgi:uncharacterized protein